MKASFLVSAFLILTGSGCGAERVGNKAWMGTARHPIEEASPTSDASTTAAEPDPADLHAEPPPSSPSASAVLGTQKGSPSPGVSGPNGERALAALMEGHQVHRPPRLRLPELHEPFGDPVFGTCITRVTDPTQWFGQKRIRHYYSKADPFNADSTRAILVGSSGVHLLYDAETWTPIHALRTASSEAELHWHPTDPSVLYQVDRVGNSSDLRGIYRYDVRSDTKQLLRDFSEYESAKGKMEGNLDGSGRYYALVGKQSDGQLEAFVYDLKKDEKSPPARVTGQMAGDWISVTPSGKYVVLMGGDRSRVYDLQMRHLRDLPKGSFGHADLCTTADGRDVMVYDGADHQLNENRNINIIDLTSGEASIGTRIGWKATPHVSCRNLDMPGWALISTQGPDPKYPNHDFEVFWLKLDGSGEVRRIAHHHSSRKNGGYFAEQHAVTNRKGTIVVFASNWGDNAPSDYVVDLRGPGFAGVSSTSVTTCR